VLVLTSLAAGPKHGYALIEDIKQFGGVTLGAGTLYGCLAKLEQSGLIEPLPSDDRRRPYQITAAGKVLLKERLERSQHVTQVGLARISGVLP